MNGLDRLARALAADGATAVAQATSTGAEVSRRQLLAAAATGAGLAAVGAAPAGSASSCIGADPTCLAAAERSYAAASAGCAKAARHRHSGLWAELRCQITALNDRVSARASCRGPRDALCPPDQHCTARGTCAEGPAAVSVPCATCAGCQTITLGDAPADGSPPPVTFAACDGGCATDGLCRTANGDPAYGTLADTLGAEGLLPDAEARVYRLFRNATLLRTLLALRYTDPNDATRASELLYLVEASSGAGQATVIEMQAGKVVAGLEVTDSGAVERVIPDIANFQPPPPLQAVLAHLSADRHLAMTTAECSFMCNAACNIALGAGLGVVGALICDGAGLLCAGVIGGTLAADTLVACFALCDQGFCKPKQYQCVATAAQSKCAAVGQVYPSAAACTASCQSGLNCFVGTQCIPVG